MDEEDFGWVDAGGGDGDLDLYIDKFFGHELIDDAVCRGIIDVVVVEIEGAADVKVDVDVGPM